MRAAWMIIGGACALSAQEGRMKDLEKLQGVWNVAALELDGQAIPAGALGGSNSLLGGGRHGSPLSRCPPSTGC